MALSVGLLLAACEDLVAPNQAGAPARGQATAPAEPSAESAELARYYRVVQNDLLTRGLLRTDGGGPDTPYTADDLARNFETIALFEEYSRGGASDRDKGRLSRWSGPVRIGVEFGDSVPPERRKRDRDSIAGYASRLARITGHPISANRGNPNFHVFIAGRDDSTMVRQRLKALIPNITNAELKLISDLPRSFYCVVVAVSGAGTPYNYTRAVALIRSEHPDLVRLSCIHEEVAQGLGLPNDSPRARPSIFNDDDEFALLTSHDEKLLKMLYDPRLKAGMTADEARPVVRIIAREMMGQEL